MSETTTGVTVTLKAGTGFEAPWIVIHAEDVDDALKQIDSGNFANLAERSVAAAEFFRAAHNVKTGLPSTPAPAGPSWSQPDPGASNYQTNPGAPVQQAAPPAGGAKQCIHGDMVYREAKPGSGKDWKAYFCPTPQGTQGQCKPQFLGR